MYVAQAQFERDGEAGESKGGKREGDRQRLTPSEKSGSKKISSSHL